MGASSVQPGKRPLHRRIEKKARRLLGLTRPYQTKRVEGTDQRWELIAAHLRPDDQNLLDVGCNIGMMTRRAADAGLVALGVEVDQRFVRKAKSRHRHAPNLSFMSMTLSPDTIRLLPQFDVTLCLSVHHHWAQQYGLDESWKMVSSLLEKTRHGL
jgi:2-polyprenyl-3-methyl-5-hydroxy-6-metoxy-1,4-benzoquinol methylase